MKEIAVSCCGPGLVLGVVPVGCCELSCCGCRISSEIVVAGMLPCPWQECHAGKTARLITDSKTDLRMTLMFAQ